MGQFLRFLVVGSMGFVVDAGLVLLLVHYGLSPVVARIPAISSAILVTWLMNRTLTFRVKIPKTHTEAVRYASVALVSAMLNFGLYSALVLTGVWPVLAVALSTATLMFLSFVSYKRFVFVQVARNPAVAAPDTQR
jgi:putative flippase GtrA